jgi:hypothetical protein
VADKTLKQSVSHARTRPGFAATRVFKLTLLSRASREWSCTLYFAVSPCQINEAQNQASLRHCKVTHFLFPLGGQTVRPANPTRPEARRKNAMWQLAPTHTWPMQHIYKNHDRPSVLVGAPIPLHHSQSAQFASPSVSHPTSGGGFT